jgi:hypothetical protein
MASSDCVETFAVAVVPEEEARRSRSRSPPAAASRKAFSAMPVTPYVDIRMTDLRFSSYMRESKDREKRTFCVCNVELCRKDGYGSERSPLVQFFVQDGEEGRNVVRFALAPSSFAKDGPSAGFSAAPAAAGGRVTSVVDGYRLVINLNEEQREWVQRYELWLQSVLVAERASIFGGKVSEESVKHNFSSLLKSNEDGSEVYMTLKTTFAVPEGFRMQPTEFRIIDAPEGVDVTVHGLDALQPWLDTYSGFRGARCRVVFSLEAYAMMTRKCGPRVVARQVILWVHRPQGQRLVASVSKVDVSGL